MTIKSKLLSALTLMFMASGGSWARKTAESPRPLNLTVVAPVVDCATLASADISAAVGSPTHISFAMRVPDGRPAPYCEVKGYAGSGSIDEARNFKEGKAEPISAAKLVWLGSSFYTPRYEEWCSANGTTMSCKPSP